MMTTATARTPVPVGHAAATRQIIGLDLVRFAAAMLVVAFHLSYWNRVCNNGYQAGYHTAWLAPFSRTGWIGVPIFFVLSGFVIAYSAERSTPASFARSRFLRLYPGVWICATLTLVTLFVLGERDHSLISEWLRSLALAPFGTLIDSSFWTLSVEIDFYLLVFFLLAARRFRQIELWMTGIAALSTATLLCGYAIDTRLLGPGRFAGFIAHVLRSRSGQLLLLRHGALFAIGVLLWLCLLQRWTVFRTAALALCTVGALLSIRADWADVVLVSHLAFSPAAAIALWAVCVIAIVLSVRHNAALHRVLGERGSRAARMLGLMTYPLYLLHQHAGDALLYRLHGRMPDLPALMLVILLVVASSYVVVRFLERPLQEHIRNLLGSSTKKREAPAASLP